MDPRGSTAPLKGWAFGAALVLGVALAKVLTIGGAAAQGKNTNYWKTYQQNSVRAWQRAVPQKAPQRASVRALPDAKETPVHGGKSAGGGKVGGADISEAERRVREIEDTRRDAVFRAEQEQAAWRRDRERAGDRKAGMPRAHALPKFAGQIADAHADSGAAKPERATKPDGAVSVLPSEADREKRVRWLDAFQRQASHLGMKGEKQPEAAEDDPDTLDGTPPPDAQPGRALRRSPANRAPGLAVQPSFPGKERGAEMPADLYEQAREQELVVTGLSAVDLETARLHGFVASQATDLDPRRQVRRLHAPGASRDEAVRALHQILPFLSVTPNYAYTIFMGSLGESDIDADARMVIERNRVSPASPEPCPSETCFGGGLIKWRSGLSACTRDVKIGVIDTSFDLTHPAFRNIKAEQAAFLDGQPPSPYDWHGTAVLSLLAGDPASGTPGLAADATYLLAAAFRSDAAGNASTDTVRLLAALAWLEARGVDIVNMSFTGPQDPAIEHAIAAMRKKGIVFVAAAGNMGPTAAPSYPAAYPDVIAVTAINRDGENYRHANRGPYIDVSAPGVDVLTALPEAQQGFKTGTSFAVPFVTAIAATRVGDPAPEEVALGAASRFLTRVPVRDLGPPGPDPIYGAGLVLAPGTCAPGRDAVARMAPALESWSAETTTFSRAGAMSPLGR